MTLIFFQNCVSPHQVPYIKELVLNSQVNEVYLIVPRYDYNERQEMGWDNKRLIDNTGIKLLYRPNEKTVKELLNENENSYCFFSGIRADADVFSWFKASLKYKVKRYIITEPPFTYNKPLWMHYIRFFLQDYKYVKYIDGILGIGEDAVKYYRNISKRWKVFPFQYVTEHNERTKGIPTGNLKLLFVGNLCKRKNVRIVIEALKGIKDIEFSVIGNGEERLELEKLANQNNVSVTFLGSKNMKEVPSIMQEHDVLVLPSLHDGWGAVVNEAMDLGLYVMVSDRCGAKMMIEKGETGDIFISNSYTSLREFILHAIKNKEFIRRNVHTNIESFSRYRGNNIAEYFINCLMK